MASLIVQSSAEMSASGMEAGMPATMSARPYRVSLPSSCASRAAASPLVSPFSTPPLGTAVVMGFRGEEEARNGECRQRLFGTPEPSNSLIHSFGCLRDVMRSTRRVFGQCTTARPTWRTFMLANRLETDVQHAETSRQLMVMCAVCIGARWSGGVEAARTFTQLFVPLGSVRCGRRGRCGAIWVRGQ